MTRETSLVPFIDDGDLRLYCGDVIETLRELPDESVDCVITSPPYWGLRDYGTGEWEGGDPECEHRTGGQVQDTKAPGAITTGQRPGVDASTCRRCGAKRIDQQIGLEQDPDAYIDKLVETFREVWRVLARHGTVWLNLGDSYASKTRGSDEGWDKSRLTNPGGVQKAQSASLRRTGERHRGKAAGLKAKDLVLMPARVALALQADGWWVRRDVIWSKKNPLPESTTDRPTSAHEYVFLLTKSGTPSHWTNPLRGTLSATKPKPDYWWFPPDDVEGEPSEVEVEGWERRNAWEGHDYFFDQEAVREPHSSTRWGGPIITQPPDTKYAVATANGFAGAAEALSREGREWNAYPEGGRNIRSVWEIAEEQEDAAAWMAQVFLEAMREGDESLASSVWEIATQPFPGAHFAVFPEKLVTKALLAGCPLEVCTVCGKPRERIVSVSYDDVGRTTNGPRSIERKHLEHGTAGYEVRREKRVETTGWTDCGHDSYRAGVVLDPFGGSGTTALVARKHRRHAVLIELSPDYCKMAAKRLQQLSLDPELLPT